MSTHTSEDVLTGTRRPPGTLARAFTAIAIVIGALFVVGGVAAWATVSSQLSSQEITVSDDAPFLGGAHVVGPLSAYAQAEAINQHALAASDGKTYAQLAQDDPTRETVMTASFLRASLFTSVVSFGVALFAVGVGVVTILLGWAQLRASRRV